MNNALRTLAESAGLSVEWTDAFGKPQTVGEDSLRAVLNALGLHCANEEQCRESREQLAAIETGDKLPPLFTATAGETFHLPRNAAHGKRRFRIEFEDGGQHDGLLALEDGSPSGFTVPNRYGYHRLFIDGSETLLAIAPPRSFGVDDAVNASGSTNSSAPGSARLWGLATQLYSLRSEHGGGIGDFTALRMLAESAARHGAAALAISPVHAMFSADLRRFSPYSPSSRLFLNALHIDPAQVMGQDAFRTALTEIGKTDLHAQLERIDLIDWPQAAGLRLEALRALFRKLRAEDRGDLEAFSREGGTGLEDHARFEALHAHFLNTRQGGASGYWREWPAAFRDPRSRDVETFAREHAEEIAFHRFLQWQAAKGLKSAQSAARAAGMPIGLISDLAVGADNGGSQAWSRQRELLIGLSIGAPPDVMSAQGQSWGLGAFSPRALKETGFKPYLEMLRAAFAHSGGVRIDHVLGLGRIWVVPEGAQASQGVYLRYPMDDLLRLIALESWRHRAIVIGEDLGTIPEGFGERLSGAGLMGIRVLLFQQGWDRFLAPHEWPAHASATTATHDTPTLAGWWAGRDIEWRTRLGLHAADSNPRHEQEHRERERARLWSAMRDAGCAQGEQPGPQAEVAPLDEAIAFVGKTPSQLVMVPLEDVLGMDEQPNLPGTVDTHPNWRRRMPDNADRMLDQEAAARRLALLDATRLEGIR